MARFLFPQWDGGGSLPPELTIVRRRGGRARGARPPAGRDRHGSQQPPARLRHLVKDASKLQRIGGYAYGLLLADALTGTLVQRLEGQFKFGRLGQQSVSSLNSDDCD